MKARSMVLALALALSLAFSSQARADSMLDFGVISPSSGTISFGGGTGPLVGTGIDVDNVVGLPSGTTLTCVGCFLNFTTGPLNSTTATSWTFGGGTTSSITVSGTVLNGSTIVASGTLLSGNFGTALVTSAGSTFKVSVASFTDVKDPALLAFFGLPTGIPYNGNFNISFSAAGTPPGGFTSTTVLSGDIVNSPVDLPSSLLLLGSGLVGFAYLTARRRS